MTAEQWALLALVRLLMERLPDPGLAEMRRRVRNQRRRRRRNEARRG